MRIFSATPPDQPDSAELAPLTAPIKRVPKWQPTRVGVGEYYHPTKYPKVALYGRIYFLDKIEILAPEVLKSLASAVRMHYEPLRRDFDPFEFLTLRSEGLRRRIAEGQAELLPLRDSLQLWCEQFHLDADWVRDIALNTLYHWTGEVITVGESHGWSIGASHGEEPLNDGERAFSYSHRGWEMTYTTKNNFIRQIRADFENRLNGYLRSAEEKAKNEGWKKTPALRKTGKQADVYRHVEWLVRWQVQQWETSRIAAEYGLGKKRKTTKPTAATAAITNAEEKTRKSQSAYKTVRDAISKAAKLIELPLRRGNSTDASASAS